MCEQNAAECYVCTETVPKPWLSVCACNERYIHDACLLKLLHSNPNLEKALRCSVCNEKYGNVEHSYVTRFYCAKKPVCLWIFALLNTAMTGSACNVGINYAHIAPENGSSRNTMLITTIIYAACSGVMWLGWLFYVARSGPGALWKPCLHTVSEFTVWRPRVGSSVGCA